MSLVLLIERRPTVAPADRKTKRVVILGDPGFASVAAAVRKVYPTGWDIDEIL
jgi:hypothetical protein